MADAAWSMRRRLRKRLLASIGGLWVAGMVAALAALWHESNEVFDSALLEVAQALTTLPPPADTGDDHAPAGFGRHEEHVVYQVYDQQGRLLLRSHAAPTAPLDAGAADGVRSVGAWRVLTLGAPDGSRRVQVAETQAHRLEVIWATGLGLLVALLATLALSAIALQWALARTFGALEPARRQLVERAPGDLRPLQATNLPLEMKPWLDAVNGLMARVHTMLEGERAFAAHTAHELRTPLAAARAQAQRLAQGATSPPQADKAQALVRQLDRLTTLAARLLQLARIESGVALHRDPVDLAELARLVVAEFSARAAERVRVEAPEAAPLVDGDVDALGIALRNLVDNALKHGGEAGRVTVRVDADVISVVDDGPGVPADDLPRLMRKFERGRSPSDGAGLGLAMVTTIARQSNATVELRSPVADGRGFAATLRFARRGATSDAA